MIAFVVDDAAATTDARVVEEQVHVIAPAGHDVTEGQYVGFDRHVGDVAENTTGIAGAQGRGLGHVVLDDIAHRDVTAIGRELTNEFASHAGATPGDHGDTTGES